MRQSRLEVVDFEEWLKVSYATSRALVHYAANGQGKISINRSDF